MLNWPRRMTTRGETAILSAAILAGILFTGALLAFTDHPGPNDFSQFYSASRLLPRVNTYDFARLAPLERQFGTSPVPFLRPLWFALFLRPLALLPFPLALLAWRALQLAACLGFVFAWPERRLFTALALVWSFPLSVALWSGQDTPFLLCGVGLILWLMGRRRPFAAGLVLAALTVKVHLFVLVPLVLLRHRMWRALAGAAAGVASLLAISLAVWPGWLTAYAAALRTPEGAGNIVNMFNISGMLLPHTSAVILLSILVLAACCTVIWRADPALGTAAAILGGVLIAPHAYMYDALLWIPAAMAAWRSPFPWLRVVAATILAPFLYIAASVPGLLHIPEITALLLIGGLLLHALRYGIRRPRGNLEIKI